MESPCVIILSGFSALGKSHFLQQIKSVNPETVILDSPFSKLGAFKQSAIQNRLLDRTINIFEKHLKLHVYSREGDKILKNQIKYIRLFTNYIKNWIANQKEANVIVLNRSIEDYLAYALLYVKHPLEVVNQYFSLISTLISEWYSYVGLNVANSLFIQFDSKNVIRMYEKEFEKFFVNTTKRYDFLKRVELGTNGMLARVKDVALTFDDILDEILKANPEPTLVLKAITPAADSLTEAYSKRNRLLIQFINQLKCF